MPLQEINSEDFLSWRRQELALGGRAVDFDWLLDIGAGIGWSYLQRLRIDSDRTVLLHRSWRDFDLEVSSEAMIPRQETELLVDLGLHRVKGQSNGRWADLGTGSGAIAISLARALPDWFGHAVDCSKDSLSLAKKNLLNLAPTKRLRTHLGNWWEPLKPWWGTFDLVISNPPYIPEALIEELHPVIRDHEPHLALSGGVDGLCACRELISIAERALSPGGWLLIEHHYDQSELLLELMLDAGLDNVEFEKDLEGVRRFAIGRRPS